MKQILAFVLLLIIGSPFAFALSDSELIQSIANVCVSGNHEEDDCKIMREAAQRFDIPELDTLVTMLCNRILDIGDKQTKAVTNKLLARAENVFGKESVEAFKCRRAVISAYGTTEKKISLDLAAENVEYATRLLARSPKSYQMQELNLLAQLELLERQSRDDSDNPQRWEQVYKIEKQVDELYEKHLGDSDEKMCIYRSLAWLKFPFSSYIDYINDVFYEQYPKETKVQSYMYNGIITNSLEYMRLAYEIGRRLYGENDLRTLSLKTDLLYIKLYQRAGDYENIYEELVEIYNKVVSNDGEKSVFAVSVKLEMWHCNILNNSRIEETGDYWSILSVVRDWYGEDSEEYLGCLNQIISQRLQVMPIQAKILSDQEQKLIETYFPSDYKKLLQNKINIFNYMYNNLDPQSFRQYIESIIDTYCKFHETQWSSISLGLQIVNNLVAIGQYEDAINIYAIILYEIKNLVGEDSNIYTYKLGDFLDVLSSTDENDYIEEICLKLINTKEYPAKSKAYLTLSNLYWGKGLYNKSEEILKEGIEQNEDKGFNIIMQLKLGDMYYNKIAGIYNKEKAEGIYSKIIPEFLKYEDETGGSLWWGYIYIANYYVANERKDDAEKIILQGYERYNQFGFYYDGIFMEFLSSIFNLYVYGFNDFDKAEKFILEHEDAIRQSNYASMHDNLIKLLMMKYEALKAKSPMNLRLMSILSQVHNEVLLMIQKLGGKEEHLMQYKDILANIWGEMIFKTSIYYHNIRSCKSNDPLFLKALTFVEEQYKSFKDIFPYVLKFEELFCKSDTNYWYNVNYIILLRAIYTYYAFVECDKEKSNEWLIKMRNSPNLFARYTATYNMVEFALMMQDFEEATRLCEEILKMAGEMPRTNHMLEEFYGVYCTACYKVGMYDKALVAAKEYQKYRSNILQNNFEMMTQTEREGFLNNGGAGSGGLELLLPNFPNELSGDVYNSMLQEKGLLLRASDRFRRSVMNSGNADLINSLNTLDGLKAELAKMEQVPNMQQGDFNISPEYWAMQEQIEVLEKTIKRDGEEYFAQTDTVPEWQDIQQHLNYDEVAIEFVMSDSLTGALVLKPDMKAPLYVPLTNSYELNAKMSDLSKLPIEEHTARLYQSDELGLYAKLWKPLESVLSGVRRVYFSPTGYLNTLAFAAIRCPGGEYLADRYDMHQLTTTAEIVKRHNRNSTNENKTALLVGDVYYSPEHEDIANEFRQLNAYSDNRAAVEDEFGYLSFTGKEIADISAVMQKSGYSCITRSGNDATEENLNLIDGDSPEILHLSTHGFFVASDEDVTTSKFLEKYPGMRFSSMYRSGLAFVGANEAWEGLSASVEDNKDGIVTSNEVSVLDLRNTRLAVLSACQTAVGYYSKEGVFGMNRGFKQAGVQSIIATLWNVNDESTSMFMSKFYSKWLSGIPMQQSFKEAMVELRELYPSPYYWAPFILVDAK